MAAQGVDLGGVDLLLHARPCEGLVRQVDGTVEKRFAKAEVAFPLQVRRAGVECRCCRCWCWLCLLLWSGIAGACADAAEGALFHFFSAVFFVVLAMVQRRVADSIAILQ